MTNKSQCIDANRELWNLWTKFNVESTEYSGLLGQLEAGGTTLEEIAIEELGDVFGKTLLHLQCHFGLDTLSWAKRGAVVTGVDFSEEAIALAWSLSRELGVNAEFVCSDIYALPAVLHKQFDIVYTSGGVLCWLPDLDRWAEIVLRFLEPDGILYILEGHPIVRTFKPRTDSNGRPVEWGYFDRGPIEVEERRSSANPAPHPAQTAYYWPHSLGEVVTALCSAGLRLEFLHEFPDVVEDRSHEEIEPGRYELRVHRQVVVPGKFSIRSTR
ncbi:MAG: class I SAM-dependent methyltransferase [Anaerolineae bacterium]